HTPDARGMLHHPLAFGDGELSEQKKALARGGGDPVRVATAGVQECRLRSLGGLFGEVDELVLDLERAQRLEFFQGQKIGHLTLPSCSICWKGGGQARWPAYRAQIDR